MPNEHQPCKRIMSNYDFFTTATVIKSAYNGVENRNVQQTILYYKKRRNFSISTLLLLEVSWRTPNGNLIDVIPFFNTDLPVGKLADVKNVIITQRLESTREYKPVPVRE